MTSLMSFSYVPPDARIYCGSKRDSRNLALDPVCGKSVAPPYAAASVIAGGVTYYFCSESCHRAYTWRQAESPSLHPSVQAG